MRASCLFMLFVMTGCGTSVPPAVTEKLDRLAVYRPGCTVAIAYRDLADDTTFEVRGSEVFHAASTMKVPVMVEAYRAAQEGRLDLDAEVEVTATFTSIVDGSRYTLSRGDDSETGLYDRVGRTTSVRELVRLMIVRSSNLATNMLVERLGADRIQATMAALGARTMRVLRGVEDIPAFRRGLNNTATAHDLAVILRAIALGETGDPGDCAEMLAILRAQEHRDLIPARLPASVQVAHKTGRITRIRHDAAVVYPSYAPPFVLVVLTRGFDDADEAADVVARLARTIYDWHMERTLD